MPFVPFSEIDQYLNTGSSDSTNLPLYRLDDSEGGIYQTLDRKTWRDAFTEVAERPYKIVPYLNMIGLAETARVFNASRAARKGTITPEEDRFLNRFLADRQREQSFGYKVWNMSLNIVPYAFEFISGGAIIKGGAAAVAKGATKGITTAAATKDLVKIGALSRLERAGARTASKLFPNVKEGSAGYRLAALLYDDTGSALIGSAKALKKLRSGGATAEKIGEARKIALSASGRHLAHAAAAAVPRTALQPHRVIDTFMKNITPEYALTPDQQGNLRRILVDEGDGIFKAFVKAFGDVYIENFSEQTGENLFLLRAMFGVNAKKAVSSAVVGKMMGKVTDQISKSEFLVGACLLYTSPSPRDS